MFHRFTCNYILKWILQNFRQWFPMENMKLAVNPKRLMIQQNHIYFWNQHPKMNKKHEKIHANHEKFFL